MKNGKVRKSLGNPMIELLPAENDDVAFLELAQRVVNGAIAVLQVHEIYLVHVDNWFDHKWLGFIQKMSLTSLSRSQVVPFDPRAEYILKYGERRARYEKEMDVLVNPANAPK